MEELDKVTTLEELSKAISSLPNNKATAERMVADNGIIFDSVKKYYGKELQKTEDCKVQSCPKSKMSMEKHIIEAMGMVHEQVSTRQYGCGLVIPEKLEGMHVLDLGSGSGRDCFALSKLVGKNGFVTGIDMTDEQLKVARDYIDYHTEKFGYSTPNVKFIQGYIERLTEAGIPEDSQDIIVSNCVMCLCPDKKSMLKEAYKVMKVGGELYFSDMYADRTVPECVQYDEVLWGEGLAGALYWKDLYSLAEEIGFSRPRLITASPMLVDQEDFKQKLGDIKYASVTYRLFKLPKERQPVKHVVYLGGIMGFPDHFKFDHKNIFKTSTAVSVDEELSTILSSSRFADEFDFQPVSKQDDCCCFIEAVEVNPFQYIANKEDKEETLIQSCSSQVQNCC
ncbi:hypothetical protein ACJMK2_006709 [Sinanodonta woodiana]|uniref:Arsenite methyltransferase n=1 Tax=Sinanodonta woodiana TaxID=1069815 RepID=A0ABD3VVB7_SINWO